MGQTKNKPLRMRDFLRFCTRTSGQYLDHIFLKINTGNRILLCKSNTQILKFLKVKNTM